MDRKGAEQLLLLLPVQKIKHTCHNHLSRVLSFWAASASTGSAHGHPSTINPKSQRFKERISPAVSSVLKYTASVSKRPAAAILLYSSCSRTQCMHISEMSGCATIMPGVVLACQPIKALHGLPFRWRDLPGQAAGLGIRRPWWFDACLL